MQLIEVILPFYNGSKYFLEQLRSIQNCLIPINFEMVILIIDDASSQDDHEYLRQVCSAYENITILRNEKNLGVVKTIERGLSISRGRYVMLSDQDDLWLPEKIKVSIEKISKIEGNLPSLVFTDLSISDEDLNITYPSMFALFKYSPQNLKNSILIQNMVTGCTIVLNRKILQVALPFPEEVVIHDHWLAICAAYSGNIGFIETPTILYRQHCNNLIGAEKVKLIQKLKSLKNVLLLKHNSHILKSIQTAQLATRLKSIGVNENAEFLERVSKSLESNSFSDILFLRSSKVINFDFKKSFLITSFFIFVTSYKIIKKWISR